MVILLPSAVNVVVGLVATFEVPMYGPICGPHAGVVPSPVVVAAAPPTTCTGVDVAKEGDEVFAYTGQEDN